MKTYECVFTRAGNENADSALHLLCLLSDFDGDLSATMYCCRNWDDNGLVEVHKFKVITVTLPDWLPFAEYKASQFNWEVVLRVLKYRSKLDIDTVPYEKANILRQTPSAVINTLATVLFGNLRSSFRKSLREQVEKWIETPPAERKYEYPLSGRQLEALVDRYSRSDPASDLYRHVRYYEMVGLK